MKRGGPLKRRTPLRSRTRLKRTPLKKKSDRQIFIEECDDLFRAILKLERGDQCEIGCCPPIILGLFHILCKGNYERLRYSRQNVLLVNWMPHHFAWHHYTANDVQYQKVEKRIQELRGGDYAIELKKLCAIMPRLTMTRLQFLKMAFTAELKELENKNEIR